MQYTDGEKEVKKPKHWDAELGVKFLPELSGQNSTPALGHPWYEYQKSDTML